MVATASDTPRPKRNKPMSDRQFVGLLGRMINQAMNAEDGDISATRSRLFDRYVGDLYGTERDGYSKFCTREVLEAVEWAKPALLRIFTGSDRVVSFDPVGPEDDDQAAQDTDVVNHKIMKANGGDGFIALHNFIDDALKAPTAYLKVWVEDEERVTTHTAKGVPATGLQILLDDPELELIEQDSRTQAVAVDVPNPTVPGETMAGIETIEVFDVKYRRTRQQKVLRIASIPGEESLVDPNLTTTNLDHADFWCHRTRKTYTELVNAGIAPEDLDNIGSYEDYDWSDEKTGRLFFDDEEPNQDVDRDDSMRFFWVHECYVWADYEGTGVAQFRRVLMIGAEIFENEETDYQPGVAMSAILMPHKHNGMSIAELVEDLQQLMTTLTRQLLDNIYKINVRRKFFSEDAMLPDGTTMEAMLNVQSEWIPVRGRAGDAVFPDQTQPVVGDILPVMQHVQASTSMRSGIAPENNVDPDVLQNSTFGAFMAGMEKAGERIELIARIMAETGFKQTFRKVHQLCRSYPDIATTIKLRNEWIDVDPSGWQDRTDMTVNVGLGFNNKQQMTMLLGQMLEMQKEAIATGLSDGVKIYNTLKKLVETAGIGAVEQFFNDPSDPNFEAPEQPPAPEMILAEAQAGALTSEQERKMLETQGKLPIEQQKAQADAFKAQQEAEAKADERQIKREELSLKRQELSLRERELDIREAEALAGIDNKNADTGFKEAQTVKTMVDAGKSGADIDNARQAAEAPEVPPTQNNSETQEE